jgi:hypothetical protein
VLPVLFDGSGHSEYVSRLPLVWSHDWEVVRQRPAGGWLPAAGDSCLGPFLLLIPLPLPLLLLLLLLLLLYW